MTAIEITHENFATEVTESEVPVLLDMWAAWCGPCRALSPIVDELASRVRRPPQGRQDRRRRRARAASDFNVLSIPTLVLVKNGEVVASAIGARPKARLAEDLQLEEHAACSLTDLTRAPAPGHRSAGRSVP